MFYCVLCEKETCYVSKFCDDCRIIKNIMNVYGYKEVKDILEKVCIRNEKQRQYKIDNVEKVIEDKVDDENQTDKSYITRSKHKQSKSI